MIFDHVKLERAVAFFQEHCWLSSINFTTENFNLKKNGFTCLKLTENELEKTFSKSI